jgi:signal transduction histidine kinase
VPNLPSTRQIRDSENEVVSAAADPQLLARAFATFNEAAGSLEKFYAQLQAEVSNLRADLEHANLKLSLSLDENARARAFLTHVLDRLPCGVVVGSPDGRIHLLNPEARRLLELDSEPQPPADLPFCELLTEWASQTDSGTGEVEHERISSDSQEKRTISVRMARMELAEGTEPETIWILRDISDQKKYAAEREESRRARALADIAAVLAHEIRNPLGSMELFTNVLSKATREMPEAHHWVVHIQSGLRSLGATVNNVLQFHETPCAELLPIRIDRALSNTLEFLGPLAKTQGHTIELDNSIGEVTVAADVHRLQQVFLNLALNGFRAMPNGGALTIRLRWVSHLDHGVLQIDFQDEGCGIEPSLVEKIFEPGFTTKAGSPGLGLSVCRKVIEQHGGKIQVESRLKRGSTFTIYLDASEELSE